MEAGGLQRSEISFRRQGSSGLIWDDKLLAAAELNRMMPPHEQDSNNKADFRELRPSRSVGSTGTLGSGGGGNDNIRQKPTAATNHYHNHRTSPDLDPPSPKVVSGCGLCGVFSKPSPSSSAAAERRPKSRKR